LAQFTWLKPGVNEIKLAEELDSLGRANDFLCKSSKGQRHTFGSRTRQGI